MGKYKLRCSCLHVDAVAFGDRFNGLRLLHDIRGGFAVVVGGTGFGALGQDAAVVGAARHDADVLFHAEGQ